MRDRGLLESAVHPPQNVAGYVDDWDLCDLAAAYLFHVAENQPFVDGNKRAALAPERFDQELAAALTAIIERPESFPGRVAQSWGASRRAAEASRRCTKGDFASRSS